MLHGCVKKGFFVISASIPMPLVKKIDTLGKKLGHDTRSETLQMMITKYFENNP